MPEEDQLISTPTTRQPQQLRSPTNVPVARPSAAPGVCTMPRPRRDEEVIRPMRDRLPKRSRSSLTLARSEFPRIDSTAHRFNDFRCSPFAVFSCFVFFFGTRKILFCLELNFYFKVKLITELL